MQISKRHKFIFVHIPKTGGTSMRHALEPFSDPWDGLTDTHENRMQWGHANPLQIRERVGETFWNEAFKFAVVRNPWDWLVSMYVFNSGTRLDELSSDAFRKNKSLFEKWVLHEMSIKSQKSFLSDAEGNLLVDYVARMDHLNHDFQYICQKLGIQASLNHRNPSLHSLYTRYHTRETREFIQKRYADDVEAFGFKFKPEHYWREWLKREVPKFTIRVALRTRLKRILGIKHEKST